MASSCSWSKKKTLSVNVTSNKLRVYSNRNHRVEDKPLRSNRLTRVQLVSVFLYMFLWPRINSTQNGNYNLKLEGLAEGRTVALNTPLVLSPADDVDARLSPQMAPNLKSSHTEKTHQMELQTSFILHRTDAVKLHNVMTTAPGLTLAHFTWKHVVSRPDTLCCTCTANC